MKESCIICGKIAHIDGDVENFLIKGVEDGKVIKIMDDCNVFRN